MRENFVNRQKRNNFDLTHRIHGSYKMGKLYPVCHIPVTAGASVNLNMAMALQAAPLMFPVQTPIKVRLSAFYVRYRNLWHEYKDFYGNRETEKSFPFISQPSTSAIFDVGGILDHLDVPVVYYASGQQANTQTCQMSTDYPSFANYSLYYGKTNTIYPTSVYKYQNNQFPYGLTTGNSNYPIISFDEKFTQGQYTSELITFPLSRTFFDEMGRQTTLSINRVNRIYPINIQVQNSSSIVVVGAFSTKGMPSAALNGLRCTVVSSNNVTFACTTSITNNTCTISLSNSKHLSDLFSLQSEGKFLAVLIESGALSGNVKMASLLPSTIEVNSSLSRADNYKSISSGLVVNPFASENGETPQSPLSAMSLRAYESIFNCFYRRERVDPLIINGRPAYDDFCPNTSGGADTYNYRLYDVPYEIDQFTGALPSPQAGDAIPLVGLTTNVLGNKITATLVDDASGETKDYNINAVVDSDGYVTNLAYTSDIPYELRANLNARIASGFDINSLRNVSNMQRFLENSIRRGYKYVDQLLSHAGVSPQYDALNYPEYLGGQTFEFNVSKITSSSATTDAALGDFVGQMNLVAGNKHSINRYCDEDGCVMVVMSIVPIPNYPQALPHHFTELSKFDFYTSEFDKISMQPITMREVAPVQSANNNVSLNEVFGYLLPWYQHKMSYDKVRGELRTTMRDNVINRIYRGVPRLNSDFIYCNGNEINNIFQITDDNVDKIFGSILFEITMRQPMSIIGQPTFH